MSILRVNKRTGNFLVMQKDCLNEPHLSFKAKGIHAYLIGLPDNWKVRVSDLAERSKDGRDAVYAGLQELIEAGYISKTTVRDEKGKFLATLYDVYEIALDFDLDCEASDDPCSSEDSGQDEALRDISTQQTNLSNIPLPENPHKGSPLPENPTLININNNKYTNKKITTAARREEIPSRMMKHRQARLGLVKKNAAASKLDLKIGRSLTHFQQEEVSAVSEQLISKHGIPIELKDLSREIEQMLLNPKAFTLAGNDFARKLNTIAKQYRTKKAMYVLKQQEAQDNALKRKENTLYSELDSMKLDLMGLERLIKAATEMEKLDCLHSLQKQKTALEKEISQKSKRLKAFHILEKRGEEAQLKLGKGAAL